MVACSSDHLASKRHQTPFLVLLQEHGLSPLAVALLRHVQDLEADDSFAGVLSSDAAAAAIGAAPHLVRTELKRLLEDGFLAAVDQAEGLRRRL